ncbi:hypothetical protein [Fulvimonas yonginensis]|uniref:Uncharacterized protein n=1 Tax=Fulvimonas yonginensis TaxID=1495200 RepID=A0ABU8J8S6_9GAMM
MLLLNLDRPDEWPDPLKVVLDEIRPIMRAWELDLPAKKATAFDPTITALGHALQPYCVRGWHCTRLTEDEATCVEAHGLEPLSAALIERRITVQEQRGALPAIVADALRAGHQGHAPNRASMIWFCFFPPREAGEGGLYRLFNYWGGEAIYGPHDPDGQAASLLRRLGVPCIVEADVPLAWLPNTFRVATSVARRDLIHHGEPVTEPVEVEHYSVRAIPGDLIRAVHRFPGPQFIALSGCDKWRASLS